MIECRIQNSSSSVIPFSWRQYATADEEFDSAAADMSDILRETSVWPARSDQQDELDRLSSGAGNAHEQLPVQISLPTELSPCMLSPAPMTCTASGHCIRCFIIKIGQNQSNMDHVKQKAGRVARAASVI